MSKTLQILNLSIQIAINKIVDSVSLSIDKGEFVALAGASGSGKSMTALAIMNLLPASALITSGHILLNGSNLLSMNRKQMRSIRGKQIGMIFQEPLTCLNPVMSIGKQMMEPLQHHERMNTRQARSKCLKLLEEVNIDDPERVFASFPHHLSGGMRQRVMIAMALSCDPDLLLADEPTTALDVTVQKKVLETLTDLQRKRKLAVLFITHDIALAATVADSIVVMNEGQIVETGDTDTIIRNPDHPYTASLINRAKSREMWMQQN